MISNKFTIYTKKQTIVRNIIDVTQFLFGMTITGLVIWVMISTQDEINILTIIMGIAAIISLIDIIIRKAFNKNSFLYKLFLKKIKSSTTLFPLTPMQNEVNAWICNKIQNSNGILIYGKPNSGKTSSVFMFLSNDTKNIELLRNISWSKDIIYVDCKNNKSDILDFFSLTGQNVNKKLPEDSLIIVDNLESMGETFLENLLNIVNSSLGKYILLSDASSLDNDLYNTLERKCMRVNYTFSVSKYSSSSFGDIYNKLTDSEKIVLLIIYYMSLSLTLIQIKDIYAILGKDISFLRLKFIITSLLHKELIKYFPFDHTYILLAKRVDMTKYHSVIGETQQNFKAVNKIFFNSQRFPESAWLGLISLPYERIIQIEPEEKERLFCVALKSGNYDNLYRALSEELTYSPIKENLFLYEAGTLYFYNSEQDKAFKKYNLLIDQEDTNDKQNRLMLKIIESTHGDVTPATQQNISSYLEKLTTDKYEYQLYAKYWRLHIKTEKGFFLLQDYTELLKDLIKLEKDIQEQELYIEVVKRCYTDIIRSYHIVKKSLPFTILSEFNMFLCKNYAKNVRIINYYTSLYVKANTLHYITLLDNILECKSCQDTYNQALVEYNQAIASGYENFKSVSACELKYIDLNLFSGDNLSKFQEYETRIKKFLSNAEINRVGVHVAYCKTLLAKLYMIQNLNDIEYHRSATRTSKNSPINTCLREAKKVYSNYHNEYGVIRIEFLNLLYKIANISDKNELHSIIKRMADILEMHPEYQRERDIIQFYQNIINRNESFGMLAISILKAYPIIMQ